MQNILDDLPIVMKAMMLQCFVLSAHGALNPPTTGPSQEEQIKFKKESAVEERVPGFLLHGGRLLKVILYGVAGVESAIVIAASEPSIHTRLPALLSDPILAVGSRLRITLPFAVGHLLMLAGCAIRVHCYRQLRDRFTFALAFRKDHTLETRGLYAVVRHPAYTGALLFIAGTYMCVRDRGSLLAALGVWGNPFGAALEYAMAGAALLASYAFVQRTEVEDDALRRQFGEEWIRWSKRTPYRLIPFVY